MIISFHRFLLIDFSSDTKIIMMYDEECIFLFQRLVRSMKFYLSTYFESVSEKILSHALSDSPLEMSSSIPVFNSVDLSRNVIDCPLTYP